MDKVQTSFNIAIDGYVFNISLDEKAPEPGDEQKFYIETTKDYIKYYASHDFRELKKRDIKHIEQFMNFAKIELVTDEDSMVLAFPDSMCSDAFYIFLEKEHLDDRSLTRIRIEKLLDEIDCLKEYIKELEKQIKPKRYYISIHADGEFKTNYDEDVFLEYIQENIQSIIPVDLLTENLSYRIYNCSTVSEALEILYPIKRTNNNVKIGGFIDWVRILNNLNLKIIPRYYGGISDVRSCIPLCFNVIETNKPGTIISNFAKETRYMQHFDNDEHIELVQDYIIVYEY